MIEHIIRRFHDETGSVRQRVEAAASEFTRPLAGSSAATLIIFAPLAFLSGVTGAFFGALSITMATCLIVSFFIAWLAVPLLSMHVLHLNIAENSRQDSSTLGNHYGRMIRALCHLRWIAPLVIAALVAWGYVSFRQIGRGFMLVMDEGGFILDYRADAGTSLTDTAQMLRQVESILQSTPEVQTYSRRTGLQLGGELTEANEGDFFIKLKPSPGRHVEQIMDDVRAQVQARTPGLQIAMLKPMAIAIVSGLSVQFPLVVIVFPILLSIGARRQRGAS